MDDLLWPGIILGLALLGLLLIRLLGDGEEGAGA